MARWPKRGSVAYYRAIEDKMEQEQEDHLERELNAEWWDEDEPTISPWME